MRCVWSRPSAWAWLTRKAAHSADRRDGLMQVTSQAHIHQIPGGSVGSIVRLTSLDNAKSSPARDKPREGQAAALRSLRQTGAVATLRSSSRDVAGSRRGDEPTFSG